MYTSFSIENFKLFDQLTVAPLARVNLIGGKNNAGKTALLEALWMHRHPTSPWDALQIAGWRNIADYESGELFADLFPQYDTDLTIKLQGQDREKRGPGTLCIRRQPRGRQTVIDRGGVSDAQLNDDAIAGFDFDRELVFEHTDESGNKSLTGAWLDVAAKSGKWRAALKDNRESAAMPEYPCVFEHPQTRRNPGDIAAMFDQAEVAGYRPSIEAIIRLLEPRLQRMTTIVDRRGNPSIHADIGDGQLYPVAMMGEGIQRLLALALAFPTARNGAIFIDEVENGLHHKALGNVWRHLYNLSQEFNVQVFAATHRYECIKAAHTAFKQGEVADELTYVRLQRHHKTQRIVCVAYDDRDGFAYALKYGREVR